jgi:hypothetical protein
MHGKRKGMGWRNFEPRNFPLTVNISSAINSPLLFQSLRTWNHFKAQSRSRSKAAAWRMELRMNRKSRGAIIWAVAERVTDKLPAPALIKPFGQPRRRRCSQSSSRNSRASSSSVLIFEMNFSIRR